MHQLGYAHSVECWNNNELVGGLYGVHLGGCFFGESMFNKITNTSKLCLIFLISIMIKNNFLLLDSQFFNPHLLQFGAYEILDAEYQIILKMGLNKKCIFPNSLNHSDSLLILQSLIQIS